LFCFPVFFLRPPNKTLRPENSLPNVPFFYHTTVLFPVPFLSVLFVLNIRIALKVNPTGPLASLYQLSCPRLFSQFCPMPPIFLFLPAFLVDLTVGCPTVSNYSRLREQDLCLPARVSLPLRPTPENLALKPAGSPSSRAMGFINEFYSLSSETGLRPSPLKRPFPSLLSFFQYPC